MTFTIVDVFSLSASVVFFFLAIFAIWQSMYFYTKGKNTESRVETALEAIKVEVNTLKTFNSKTLDRLVKHVTSPTGEFEQAIDIFNKKFDNFTDLINNIKIPPVQNGTSPSEIALRAEILNAYIIIWNYTASTNVWAAQCLPSIDEFDEQNNYHALVKRFIDRSFADFNHLTGIVDSLDINEIKLQNILVLYDEVKTFLSDFVGDTSAQFVKRAKKV